MTVPGITLLQISMTISPRWRNFRLDDYRRADTSPIHYVVLIEAVDVLAHFFEQIVIPTSVHTELLNSATPEVVRKWVSRPPNWLAIRSALHLVPLNLDPGETEAIALAKEIGAFALLLDDSDARQAAKKEGLLVTGTIGILEPLRAKSNCYP